VQHVYNIDMVYLTFKYLKYSTYVCAINVCSISMHHMYVPHMCMYQLSESAINLYHLYVPHMYMLVLCVICMSIQAPFVRAPFVNMAHVSTHKDNTCSIYKTYEMAILIVQIIICYRQFDDQWILHATYRWLNPNIFGVYETILNLDVTGVHAGYWFEYFGAMKTILNMLN
jgi:hypothetical protein